MAGMKVAELKAELEVRGLDTAGKKIELVARLTAAVDAETLAQANSAATSALPAASNSTTDGTGDTGRGSKMDDDAQTGEEQCIPSPSPGAGSIRNPDRLEEMSTVGLLMGLSIWHGLHLNLKLATPYVALLLGRKLKHPEDLEVVDPVVYRSLCWMRENDPEGLALEFSDDVQVEGIDAARANRTGGGAMRDTMNSGGTAGPGGSSSATTTVTVPLDQSGSIPHDAPVTADNVDRYITLMSELRLERAVAPEMEALRNGMRRIIDAPLLKPFTELEFLMPGARGFAHCLLSGKLYSILRLRG
jgi:hypothetical protein